MIEKITAIQKHLSEKMGTIKYIQKELQSNKLLQEKSEQERLNLEQAQLIIQNAAQMTQQQLEYHVSELVTLAMESVFENPYSLKLVFDTKRGKTEADIFFEDLAGNQIKPLEASGGGAVDIASFALQVSLWSLANPKTSPVFILDEPLKWLKGNGMPEKGASLIKEVSDRLGIQIIMVSHAEELIESSDHVIPIIKKNGISKLKN